MVWIKRLILSLPFLIAAVLTILMAIADHFHLYREHIAGCRPSRSPSRHGKNGTRPWHEGTCSVRHPLCHTLPRARRSIGNPARLSRCAAMAVRIWKI